MFRLILFTILFFSSVAFAEDVSFQWKHNNPENVDKYNLYAREYPEGQYVKKWTGAEMTCTVTLSDGISFGIIVTAENVHGESDYSQEVVYTPEVILPPIILPTRPSSLTITFN
ncbi:MAG: hypothetical protein V2I62_00665 [Bacteroidales bacterium]|jgi:hypothetical protein|nr:hypothetical protein [Bacteroidales bacterium]